MMPMRRAGARLRRGFTLMEMSIVMAIMAVAASLIAPALVKFGQEQPAGSADKLLALLHDARETAVQRHVLVTLRLDPATLNYEADTLDTNGVGAIAAGKLDLDASLSLITDQPRLQYVFQPSGAAFADTVVVRGGDRPLWVGVDAWSGVASAQAR